MGQRCTLDEAVGHLLQGGSPLLLGASGMGLSTLLERIAAAVAAGHEDVLVVFPEARPVHGGAELVRRLQRALRRGVKGAQDDVLDDIAQAWTTEGEAEPHAGLATEMARFEEMLADLAEVQQRVIAVVDRLDAWRVGDTEGDEGEVVGLWLRELLEARHRPGLQLLGAGEPGLERESAAPQAELLRVLERVPVDPLSEEEVRALVAAVAPELDESVASHIHRMVGGHPRLVCLLTQQLQRWVARRGELTEVDRLALSASVDADVLATVERGLALLRRSGEAALIDALFRASTTAEPGAFDAGQLVRLWPLGLVDAEGRIPERVRVVIARGAAVARVAAGERPPVVAESGESADTPEEGEGLDLGRKERLLFNYLRERPGTPVDWHELAAAYFANEPEILEDEGKALRTLRAAVNRINSKLAPSERAARSGWKVVRYARGRGFYVERDALESVLH